MFNLTLAKEKGIITDEMVKEAYLDRKQKYLEFRDKDNDSINSVKTNNEQLMAFMENDYIELLEDGYYAIRTENAREHYDELLQMLEEHIQNSKTEEKNGLFQNQKPITDFKDVIQSITTRKPESTSELIKRIREDAELKHPMPKDKENAENEI